MNVSSLHLVGFLSHVDTRLTLPATGVILVTGENGAGKSSLAEAVSFGLWGKTLRGTDPWADKDGRVEVECSGGLRVVRSQKKGKAGVTFTVGSDPATVYETPTKAQEALEAIVGGHEVWRRSHVFSSSDAALFSGSTDGERKRFIERILGVERFDPALEACRVELRKAEKDLAAVDADSRVLREKIAGAEQRLNDAVSAAGLATDDVPADTAARMQALAAKLSLARKRVNAVSGAMTGSGGAKATALSVLRHRQTESSRLAAGVCPTCNQVIPDSLRAALAAGVAEAEAAAAEATAAGDAALADLRDQLDEAREAEGSLSEKIGRLQQKLAAGEATRRQREGMEAARVQAQADLAAAGAALAKVDARLAEASTRAGVLRATERVLGLKGVRAHVLGRALSGLEVAANAWLARLASKDLRVSLGSDGVAALDVVGAGGGNGYKGASGGERRRIDVALLLGLGEFAAASAGQSGGLLVLDEVLDALDKDGLERACRAIEELAQDRPVLVVSHLDELVATLRPVLSLRVAAGVVTIA